MARDPTQGSLREASLLFLAPIIWGFGFVATRETLAGSGPLWSNALRFGAAALCLAPFAVRRAGALDRRGRQLGVTLGLLLFVAFSLQTVGLLWTTVSRSSFLTGLYAVFTPLFGPLFGRRPRPVQVAAAGIALSGLFLLAHPERGPVTLGRGDLLTLGCAAVTALQILVVDRAATGNDPVAVNFFQLASLAVVSLAAARVFEGPLVFHPSARVLWAQAYLVLLSSIVAFSLQLRAQQRLSPSAAAMIFLLEAPVGALAGGLFAGDRLTALQAGGCALMLAACGLAVLNGEREAPAAPLPVS